MRKLFNVNTLNIFADASIKQKEDGNYISCSGALCVITKNDGSTEVIDQDYIVLDNSTNNRGETYAVYMAVLFALKYRYQFDVINVISDSQFVIYSLTKWIFKWINNIKDDSYINASGNEVANQDFIKMIINTIIMNNIYINFYHQKGHANTNSKTSKAKHVFYKSNGIMLDDFEVKSICYYNDMVDIYSRYKLEEIPMNIRMPLIYGCNFNEKQYKELVNNV